MGFNVRTCGNIWQRAKGLFGTNWRGGYEKKQGKYMIFLV